MKVTNTGSTSAELTPVMNGVIPVHKRNRITGFIRASDDKLFPVIKGNITAAYILATKRQRLPVQILIDTREQKPLWLLSDAIQKLHVGDYTTKKLLGKFHIERKSLEDLYGTMTNGHSRFKRELKRAKDTKCKLVIFVEGTYEDFCNKNFKRGDERKIKGETLCRIIRTFQKNHKIEVVWHPNRITMMKSVLSRLKKEEKQWK